MLNRVVGALFRAMLVMVLVALPAAMIPGTAPDARQLIALVALFAGFLVFAEYQAPTPALLGFRDAPPYNRTRWVMLALILLCTAIAASPPDAADPPARLLVAAVAELCGVALDLPLSPVRAVTTLLGDADAATVAQLRASAGIAFMVALLSLAGFVISLRLRPWPQRVHGFNVWVNLPNFDPAASGIDPAARLERDARANFILGLAMPYLAPALAGPGGAGLAPYLLASPQTVTWTIAAWSFLPAALVMRGIALGRVATLIRAQRRALAGPDGLRALAAA